MLGRCPSSVAFILFRGKFIALQKKFGVIQPIAVGYYFHRLASKCVNKHALTALKNTFAPAQLDVEVSVAARQPFILPVVFSPTCLKTSLLSKLTSLMLSIVSVEIRSYRLWPTSCLRFTFSATQPIIISPSFNIVNKQSSLGVQQGDPIDPLLFA